MGFTNTVKSGFSKSFHKKIEKRALIDWVSVTFHHMQIDYDNGQYHLSNLKKDINPFLTFFGYSEFEIYTRNFGFNGFRSTLEIGEHIKFLYGGESTINKEGNYTCQLLMSGAACREYEMHMSGDWVGLFDYILRLNPTINRLDIAIDDFEASEIDIYDIEKIIRNNEFISPMRKVKYVIGENYLNSTVLSEGFSITLGSPSSSQLQIYDKLLERRIKGEDDRGLNLWYRYEMRIVKDKAKYVMEQFVLNVKRNNFNTFMKLASSILYEFLDLKQKSNDSNKSRWKTLESWLLFLNDVEKIDFNSFGEVPSTLSTRIEWYNHAIKSVNADFYLSNKYIFEIMVLEGILNSMRDLVENQNFQKLARINNDRSIHKLEPITFENVNVEIEKLELQIERLKGGDSDV